MKRILVFVFFFFLFPSFLIAQTSEEKRTVEEEKRESLRPSEIQILKTQKITRPPVVPADLVYFAELMPRRVAYRYDACKALVILAGVEDQYIDLDSQVAFLKKERLIPKRYEAEFDPMKPLRKGLAAFMFCRVLEIKGGLYIGLFGLNERYALKELIYEGIMPYGNAKDIVSGEELVLTLTQAANFLSKKAELQRDKTQ